MTRILWVAAALALCLPSASAQERGQLGLGVMVGAPAGGSAKYFLAETHAVDAAIGYNNNLALHADYLWHGWDVLPRPHEGKLAAYAGLGGRFRNRDDEEMEFGFRVPGGAAYWLARHPIELFIELAPVFRVNARNTITLDGAVGIRYFFERSPRR
ncbi:MAG: hypothetical protein HY554_05540 [Elusimicrobia bacterium]|nr:hypothetical protein [Elusimicrobiota bacterium]